MRIALALAAALVLWGLLPLPWEAYLPANVVLAGLLLLWARSRGHTLDELGLHRANLGRGAIVGIGSAAVVIAAIGVGVLLAHRDPMATRLVSAQGDVGPLGLGFEALVRIPVATVMFEAVAFRGVLFAAVRRVASTWVTVAITSIAFGLSHIGPTLRELGDVSGVAQPLAAVAGIVAITTLAGVVFAVLRLASRSLVASAMTHWTMNAVGLAVAVALVVR